MPDSAVFSHGFANETMKLPPSSLILALGAAAFLVQAAPEDPHGMLPGQDKAPLLLWSGTKGQAVKARLLGRDTSNLVLELENGVQRTVPLTWFTAASVRQAAEEAARQADHPIADVRDMRFVKVRRGRFVMGSPPDEIGRMFLTDSTPNPNAPANEPTGEIEPLRKVEITKDFWIKATEVTWAEWNAVRERAADYGYSDLGEGRNGFEGDPSGKHPVTSVSWWDAIKWCNLKSQIENKTPAYYITPNFNPADILMTGNPVPYVRWDASGYRLPTEAEWEFACREGRGAGNDAFHSGRLRQAGVEPIDISLDKVGWYGGNSSGNTRPVASKEPNRFGLHDMHGNVAEWCWDWEGLVTTQDSEDPHGPPSGRFRIFRGGSWADPAMCCRAAYRGNLSPNAPLSCFVGFRPVSGSDPAAQDDGGKPRK